MQQERQWMCALIIAFIFSGHAMAEEKWIVGRGSQVVVPSPDLTEVEQIAAGYFHTVGLKSDGSVTAFGENIYGQCLVPTPNADFVAVAAGGYHSLGLKSN
jgi:Regulator of chromosome condensation (RCC1) repeat